MDARIAAKIDAAAVELGIDLTADPDDVYFEAADAAVAAGSSTIYAGLAVALDAAMLRDPEALERYRAIWGYEYAGVDPVARSSRPARRSPRIAVGTAPGTAPGATVPANPRARSHS
jgi:hypothetical protein